MVCSSICKYFAIARPLIAPPLIKMLYRYGDGIPDELADVGISDE